MEKNACCDLTEKLAISFDFRFRVARSAKGISGVIFFSVEILTSLWHFHKVHIQQTPYWCPFATQFLGQKDRRRHRVF